MPSDQSSFLLGAGVGGGREEQGEREEQGGGGNRGEQGGKGPGGGGGAGGQARGGESSLPNIPLPQRLVIVIKVMFCPIGVKRSLPDFLLYSCNFCQL